jgi:phosphotransferase system enzyme I (PtsI)
MVLGFATEGGSSTSHTAIMARSLNIPAVVGIKDLFKKIEDASGVLLDGYNGTLVLNPTAKTSFEYGQVGKQRLEVEQQLKHLVSKPARTWDDRRIIVSANMDLVEELPFLETNGAEGIGLFRTEMLFLNRLDFPDEEEQYEVYRKVIQATGDHGTIIRTLDLGGDKLPATGSMIHEANPFLGWRAIRYCLQERNIFKAQLRAIARAAHGYRARIMFPMIATLEELLEAKIIWKNTLDELDSENLPRAQNIELGMMIEVPSAALIADQLVEHVDFFSVGTNDLIGYTLAMDRANSRVSYLYQPTHPAILRLLRQLTRVAHDNGRWVGVCGEAASDVRLTPLFVGLGIDELSMGAAFISRVKKAIHDLSYKDMSVIVDQLCDLGTSRDVDQKLNEIVQQYYPELLI